MTGNAFGSVSGFLGSSPNGLAVSSLDLRFTPTTNAAYNGSYVLSTNTTNGVSLLFSLKDLSTNFIILQSTLLNDSANLAGHLTAATSTS